VLDPALSDEQRQAAAVILNSRDRVVALKGTQPIGYRHILERAMSARFRLEFAPR
jgi:hypothetical protein